MAGQIALPVAIDVQSADAATTGKSMEGIGTGGPIEEAVSADTVAAERVHETARHRRNV
jgi:hypothetical protein